jgi:WD40 repeat protein
MLTLAGLGGFAANAQTSDGPRLVAQLASGQVIACAYSSDGRTVLTGGREGKARLWDVATGEELQSFQGEAWITHASVSSDNRNVLTVSILDDKTAVQLWDKPSGKQLGRISPLAGNLVFGLNSADGSTITTANWVEKDDQGNKLPAGGGAKIQMWNVVTGKELSHFLVPGAGAVGMLTVVSPDGRKLFSGDGNGPAIWDVETGKLLLRLGNSDGVVSAAAFSADGSKVAWGTIPGVVQLWDLGTGKQIQRFAADGPSMFIGSVQSVSISPDGSRVLAASNDDDARLWDAATGKQLTLFQASDDRINAAVNCAAISPDGTQALTAADDQTARLWDVKSGKELQRLIGQADEVAALAFVDGGLGIVEVSGTGMVWLWDAGSGKALLRPMVSSSSAPAPAPGSAATTLPVSTAAGSYLSPVVLSPDGGRVFLAGFHGEQGVWDVQTGKEIQSFPPPNLAFSAVDFSPDGSKLLSANHGPTFSLWDVGTGKEIQHFTVDPGFRPSILYPEGDFRDGVEHLALSPDGHAALTSDSEGSTRLWNVDTGKQVRVLKVKTYEDLAVGFSPDSSKLITENVDGSATLREAKSGKDLQHFGKASAPSFSADGHRVLMGGSIWNVDTGKELQSFEVPSGSEPAWTLSPDGSKVLMGTQDGATKLWDATTGKELATLYCLRDGTWAVVDPEYHFDTGNIDGTVALHWVNDGDPVRVSPLAAFKDGHYTPGLLKYILSGQQLPPVQ